MQQYECLTLIYFLYTCLIFSFTSFAFYIFVIAPDDGWNMLCV